MYTRVVLFGVSDALVQQTRGSADTLVQQTRGSAYTWFSRHVVQQTRGSSYTWFIRHVVQQTRWFSRHVVQTSVRETFYTLVARERQALKNRADEWRAANFNRVVYVRN